MPKLDEFFLYIETFDYIPSSSMNNYTSLRNEHFRFHRFIGSDTIYRIVYPESNFLNGTFVGYCFDYGPMFVIF